MIPFLILVVTRLSHPQLFDPDQTPLPVTERTFAARANRHPFIIIPGLSGSGLEVKEKNETKWGRLWIDTLRTLPLVIRGWMKDIKPTFNATAMTYQSASHVDVRVKDFGGLQGVNYLDSRLGKLTQAYNPLTKALIEAGYVERKDLYAAPYDWRLVNVFGHAATAYYEDLKKLVETAFRANNNKKVVLCGHSAGGIVAHRFVTSGVVNQTWIDTYIFAVITSGAPFGGAPMAFGYSASPRKWMFPWIGASTISTLTQDCACLHWMIPNKNAFNDDYVVGQLKTSKGDIVRNITMKNMTWTYDQANKSGVKTAIQRTRSITDQPLAQPKVMTHVMYSIGVNTTAGVILNATNPRWWSDTHSDYYVDGDGTVPTVSLSVPRKWRDTSLVKFHTYRGCDHMGIIQDAVPIARILDIIAPATTAEMEYEDSLNPPDDF
ncbi:putative Phosphatidylcholine-sterol acyltransferase [Blattamonas nauphoetae]|uniref:Phosphatidylcholine-sterol acyltransferase n=1 Tax=Blattamonas nauphoetae TaxID=2049346 RepID=A0ABQ9Y8F5_9EUKA|nr:putative Phosphatidylcholine-sterol acyltransferase [Blattamonas nauphoetae]